MECKPLKEGDEVEDIDGDSKSNLHRKLAVEAAECFDKGEFANTLSLLMKLQEQRPLDLRFTHNAAVVEFYQTGFSNVDEFKKKLNAVCSLVLDALLFLLRIVAHSMH